MRKLVALVSGILVVALISTVHAWNHVGHMTSAAIAYADLKERNAAVITRVVKVLKQHPHFQSMWAPKLEKVSSEERDLCLFMLASTWPDDIRKKHLDYSKPEWHYVNIPYSPGKVDGKIPRAASILTALPANRSIASSDTNTGAARAVALCWLLHLTEDITQPMHTVALVNKQLPAQDGDKGGNRFFVKDKPDGETKKLHKFWDQLPVKSGNLEAIQKRAAALMSKPEFSRQSFADQLRPQSFKDWAIATYKLAKKHAYLDGALPISTNKDDGTLLQKDCQREAKEIAQRQIVLSGYRISDALTDLFKQ